MTPKADQTQNPSHNLRRDEWLPALGALSQAELQEAVPALLEEYALEHQRLPEDGLGLLTIRDGAFDQPFYLGEFPVATAHIHLRNESGQEFAGAAHDLGDAAQKAVHMAVCDAILDNSLPETPEVLALVQTGLDRIQARHRQRRAMLERTRVDFDLLAKDMEGSDGD